VCHKCHPFFTGEQRIVDTAGQVERFMKRINAKEQLAATQPAPEEKKAKKEKRRQKGTTTVSLAPTPEAPAELPLAVIEEEKPAEPPSAPQAEQPSAPVVAEPILPVATETHVVEPTSVEPPTPVESALPVEAKVEESAPIAAEASAPENQMEEPAHIAKTTTGDDLTIIEGIGPKIAHILNDAGIHTYRDWANTSSEKLQELL
jgi:predicted flap endonuclease-1-like 5' DNA nuclease